MNPAPELTIDFASGDLELRYSSRSVNLRNVALSNGSAPDAEIVPLLDGEWWRVKSIRFEDFDLMVSVQDAACGRIVFVAPPAEYDFNASETLAHRLVDRLRELSASGSWLGDQRVVYSWGTLDLFREWRDGAWGARFVLRPPDSSDTERGGSSG